MAAPAPARPMPVRSFRQETQPAIVPLTGNVQFTTFNQPQQNLQVGRSGWLHKIFLYWTGTLTTGTGTPAGAWGTYPPLPFSLIKRLRLYTNTNNELINVTGFGLYLLNKMYRRNADPLTDLIQTANSTNRAGLITAPSGTPAASTAYTVNGWLEIPVTTDDAMFLGALLLQSDQVTMNLEVTFAGASDTGNVSGVTVTPLITFTASAFFFDDPPPDAQGRRPTPNQNYLHILKEENRLIGGVNEQVYRVPLGNTYVKVGAMMENNSAPIAFANMGNVGLRYSQIISPFNESYPLHLARNKAYFDQALPDGLVWWDRTLGSGVPGLWEGRDFINSSTTADLELVVNLASGLSLVTPNMRLITEQLAPLGGLR